jgi:hypothetical protein
MALRATVLPSTLLGAALLIASCSPGVGTYHRGPGGGSGPDASAATGSDGGGGPNNPNNNDGSIDPGGGSCAPDSPDQSGCSCSTSGASMACYPANVDPKTRNVGACKDGMQSCVSGGEFSEWGPCTGAITPSPENCSDGIDNDCNGLTDCADPACAGAPGCCGGSRACYDGPMGTEGVGPCKGGMQTCANGVWSMTCTGEVLPSMENCTDGIDNDCNGLTDCADPACANAPNCSGCTNGMTRPCYDGPMGTENVGICHGGTQTCVNGQWQMTCVGEQLPQAEVCSDNMDHNCNGLPGCLDILSCALDPACQNSCTQASVDPGCVCPTGSGDQALCPGGYFGQTPTGGGGQPCLSNADCAAGLTCFFFMCTPPSGLAQEECCPCTASVCATQPNCCAEAVCATDPSCAGMTCKPLPQMCNGMTNADCDDFPEDCDEPCCKCTMCP